MMLLRHAIASGGRLRTRAPSSVGIKTFSRVIVQSGWNNGAPIACFSQKRRPLSSGSESEEATHNFTFDNRENPLAGGNETTMHHHPLPTTSGGRTNALPPRSHRTPSTTNSSSNNSNNDNGCLPLAESGVMASSPPQRRHRGEGASLPALLNFASPAAGEEERLAGVWVEHGEVAEVVEAAAAAPGVTVETPPANGLSFSNNSLKQGIIERGAKGLRGPSATVDDAWGLDGNSGLASTTAAAAATKTEASLMNDVNDADVALDGIGVDKKADRRRVGQQVKDKRAHKMWVTMKGGDAVSEHEWEEDGAAGQAKDDTAVIQFHSQKEVDDLRFLGFGVVKEDKAEDIRTLVDSFTAPALAAALRDRETALHACAHLLEKGDLAGVRRVLRPFTADQVSKSRTALRRLDLDPEGFTKTHMYTLIKVLQRLPRHVTTLTEQRASVMIPLCNVDGVASVLLTKRSSTMRAHKNEVCFPGGKVDIGADQHIIQTALREMGEEIGILESSVDVLGVLRCDWAEVASLVGVAVTPVIGFVGNLSREQINPNPDEVSHCFTIPIKYLLQQDRWKTEKYKAPAFVGGPYVIWGLTGYILHRFVNDVLRKHLVIV